MWPEKNSFHDHDITSKMEKKQLVLDFENNFGQFFAFLILVSGINFNSHALESLYNWHLPYNKGVQS